MWRCSGGPGRRGARTPPSAVLPAAGCGSAACGTAGRLPAPIKLLPQIPSQIKDEEAEKQAGGCGLQRMGPGTLTTACLPLPLTASSPPHFLSPLSSCPSSPSATSDSWDLSPSLTSHRRGQRGPQLRKVRQHLPRGLEEHTCPQLFPRGSRRAPRPPSRAKAGLRPPFSSRQVPITPRWTRQPEGTLPATPPAGPSSPSADFRHFLKAK